MGLALRGPRHSGCGTTTASEAASVASTTHRSGSGWLPKISSQREASDSEAVVCMVGGGSVGVGQRDLTRGAIGGEWWSGDGWAWQCGTYVRTVCSESWT